jgi:hypothetical protein
VGEAFTARRQALLALIRDLLARGVPLHGIGLQGHIPGQYEIDEDAVSRFVSEIRSLGLSVHVTELDVIDKELPGPITVRDVIVAARAHDFLHAVFAAARPSVIAANVEQACRRTDQSSAAVRRILSAEAAVVRDRLFLSEKRLAPRPSDHCAQRGIELTVRSPN